MSKEKHLRRREVDPEYFMAAEERFLDTVDRAIALAVPVRPNVFVETGTLYGDRTEMAMARFDAIFTIELSEHFHERAKKKFSDDPAIACLLGDSAVVLETFVPEPIPIFFLLDAHPCRLGVDSQDRHHVAKGKFPLWEELAVISQRRNVTDIVCVDDRHNQNRTAEWLQLHNKPTFWLDVTDDAIEAAIVGREILASQKINNTFTMVVR